MDFNSDFYLRSKFKLAVKECYHEAFIVFCAFYKYLTNHNDSVCQHARNTVNSESWLRGFPSYLEF